MFSLRDQKRYGSVGVTLIVLFSAMAAFAAGLVSDTSSGGQGVVVTDGYTVTDIVYGNSINTSSNNSSTDITSVTFKLYRDGENSQTPVSGDDTTVYVQLLPSANWTQCSVTVSPNVTCVPVASQRISYAALTGMNIVAYDNNEEEPVSPQGASGEVTVTGGDNIYDIYIGPETWRVHEFRTVGESTLTVTGDSIDVEYLVVAGGGGGGTSSGQNAGAGGGGAGGLRTNINESPTTLSVDQHNITVGAGGSGGAPGTVGANGNASALGALVTTVGGGAGGRQAAFGGQMGGSGGGGASGTSSAITIAGGSATAGEGNDGGAGTVATIRGGGGGGGAGAVGGDTAGSVAGAGGAGTSNTITGVSVIYGGGGGGGSNSNSAGTKGLGGAGGGGDGGLYNVNAASGIDGTGGGGGGAGRSLSDAGDGGDGIVIIRYKVSDEFSPLSLSPALWLDASDTATITESSGSVSQWDDKSGNGRNVVQWVSSLQPTSGTRTINGLNVVDFFDDAMRTTSAITLNQPNTVFGVLKIDTIGPQGGYFYDGFDSSNRNAIFWTSTQLSVFAGSQRNVGPPDFNSAHYYTTVFNGSSSSHAVDGVSLATGNVGAQPWNLITVGARLSENVGLRGAIAELIVVNRLTSASETDSVESYLAAKWGL